MLMCTCYFSTFCAQITQHSAPSHEANVAVGETYELSQDNLIKIDGPVDNEELKPHQDLWTLFNDMFVVHSDSTTDVNEKKVPLYSM